MHYDNGFELLIEVVFYMSPQLGGIAPKSQDNVIPLCLGEGESRPHFHLRSLSIICELVLMRDKTVHINNLTGEYIMEMSNLKHPQYYMTSFELDFRIFELQPKNDQLSIIFTP